MKKNIGMLVAALILLTAWTPARAIPSTPGTLSLPAAASNSPVIDLGVAFDETSGKSVHGYAIVRYRTGFHHNPNHGGGPGGGGGGGGGASNCYGFFANGAKWKSIEPWIVNPANTKGLSDAFVSSNLAANIAKWEDAADGIIGNGGGVNILGNGSMTNATLLADTAAPDGQNEIYFANIANSGAIAVTIVWGVFSGPPSQRELVEWDQVYDDADYDWSATGEAGKMDFENIATHELGHSAGLSDLYTLSCANETMYGYADLGETNKRTLESGDIAGVNALY